MQTFDIESATGTNHQAPSTMHLDLAFSPLNEPLVWRQDKAPHLTAAISATVLVGQSQSESAGPSRGTFAADPITVMTDTLPIAALGIKPGDTLTRKRSGIVLTVQQISKDPDLGCVIVCTANASAPK